VGALDTLRILAVNDAAVEQYGYSREEFLARNLYDLRAPAERERLTKAISTEGASSCHAGTWPHQRKDGSTILVDVYSSPTDFEGTPARISVLMDVTERKRAEEALNKSERSLRELADAMPQIVWAAQPDGSIDYYNRRWFDYTGMTFEQTLGWGWKPVLHPDDLQPCIDRWTEAFSSGQPYQIEYRFKRASDGTYRWHLGRALPVREADGTIVRWNGTCTDIHDQKLVEQALVESEKSFREVTESLPQLIWTCAEDGRCDYLSRQWLEYTGVTEQEQFGFGWAERIHPDDRAHGVEVWAESFRHGTLYDAELRIRRADGKYRWFTNRAVPLRDGSGAVRKWFGTSTDVDDLKRAEEEIQQLNAELEQRVVVRTAQLEAANKELEAFSYSVSHDLRAPLRSVDSFARIIVEDYGEKLDAEGNRLLGVVCSEAKRMGQLIDDLLDFSRVGRKELSTGLVNMTVLARDVFDGLASAARKHVRHFDLQPLPDATVDRSMFRQVFVNLINNAAKFTSRADEPAIEIGCTTADGMHTYYVKDNGAGFDERYVHKLFGVFQRLHAEHEFEGTGVGLAIVQRIVHRHGGKVWAEGKINQGATVYFALPTKEETPT
jgi:PAS domain S-box-containing protein